MNSGYWKEITPVPGTGSGNRSVMVPVMGISPLFIRGIPLSGNRTALSGIPAVLGLSEKGNSGNRPARHQLRTLAAVIILTARRLTGSNGTNPSLAVQTLSGIAENYPQSATGTLSPVSYRHP